MIILVVVIMVVGMVLTEGKFAMQTSKPCMPRYSLPTNAPNQTNIQLLYLVLISSESNLPYKAYEAISDDYDPGQDTAGQDDVTSLDSMKHTITMEVSL